MITMIPARSHGEPMAANAPVSPVSPASPAATTANPTPASNMIEATIPLKAASGPVTTAGATDAVLPPAEIPCGLEQTDNHYQIVEIKEPTRLQPKNAQGQECRYRAHFILTHSGASLDCQGALILGSQIDEDKSFEKRLPPPPATEEDAEADAKLPRPVKPLYGVLIGGETSVNPLTRVHVKNCRVEGFERNFGIEVREPQVGADLAIEDSKSLNARAYGVFVGPRVTNALFRKLDVHRSQASGFFFSPGATGNTVTLSRIVDNGQATFMPHQDGITIDSAPRNQFIANLFENNGMAGLSLFHNCGEYGLPRPDSQPNENVVRANHFKNEKIGVWIASRQSMNQQLLSCSAAKTFDDSNWDIVEDFARANIIQKNTFTNSHVGIRVEDDDNRLLANTFQITNKNGIAILIGHRFGRPRALRMPVQGTILTGNTAQTAGKFAYQYCFLQTGTQLNDNKSNQQLISKLTLAKDGCGIHEGPTEPPRLPAFTEENE